MNSPRWFLFDKKDGVLEIFISGEIDDEHSGAFLDELRDNLPVERINLHINSVGGDVFTAVAVYNRLSYLSREGTKVCAFIDGIAASAGAVIAMAAAEITIPDTSFMMIHAPNGDDERLVSLFTDTFTRVIANRTGRSRDEVATLLQNGTWLNGRQAIWERLADTVADPVYGRLKNV